MSEHILQLSEVQSSKEVISSNLILARDYFTHDLNLGSVSIESINASGHNEKSDKLSNIFNSSNSTEKENGETAKNVTIEISTREKITDTETRSAAQIFIIQLATVLFNTGAPVHIIESLCSGAAEGLEIKCHVAAAPSQLQITFYKQGYSIWCFLQLDSPQYSYLGSPKIGFNVYGMERCDSLARHVQSGELTAEEAVEALDLIVATNQLYPLWLIILSFAFCGVAPVAIFFHGGFAEAVVVFVGGGLCGVVSVFVVGSSPERLKPAEFILYSLVQGFVARVASTLFNTCTLPVALASMLVMLPGLPFTQGITEVCYGSIMAGTSRFFQSAIHTMQLGFGLVLGISLVFWAPTYNVTTDICVSRWFGIDNPFAVWSFVIGMGFVCLTCVNILIGAHPKQWLITNAGAVVAVLVSFGGGELFSNEISTLLASWSLATTVSLLCLYRKVEPMAYFYVGIIVLVPGCLGVRSATALFITKNDGSGVGIGMVTVALALAIGLLMSRVLFPVVFVDVNSVEFRTSDQRRLSVLSLKRGIQQRRLTLDLPGPPKEPSGRLH